LSDLPLFQSHIRIASELVEETLHVVRLSNLALCPLLVYFGIAESRSTMSRRAVIFWPDAKQVSIEDVNKISNEEDRWAGALTSIKMSGKWHKAKVRLISCK
jgi:hypothetical protein